MSAAPSPRREPLAVALVLVNVGLAAVLIHRRMNRPAPGGLPPGHPDVSVPFVPPAPVSKTKSTAPFALTGLVKLSPGLKEPWPRGAYVFIIARAEGGGPPYAVRRYPAMTPPFTFTLGSENVMLPGAPMPKLLVVSVRVDQDGDALTRQLGDLEGGPSSPVAPGSVVAVTVDRPVQLAPTPGAR